MMNTSNSNSNNNNHTRRDQQHSGTYTSIDDFDIDNAVLPIHNNREISTTSHQRVLQLQEEGRAHFLYASPSFLAVKQRIERSRRAAVLARLRIDRIYSSSRRRRSSSSIWPRLPLSSNNFELHLRLVRNEASLAVLRDILEIRRKADARRATQEACNLKIQHAEARRRSALLSAAAVAVARSRLRKRERKQQQRQDHPSPTSRASSEFTPPLSYEDMRSKTTAQLLQMLSDLRDSSDNRLHAMVQGELGARSKETGLTAFHAFLDCQEFTASRAIAAATEPRARLDDDEYDDYGLLQQGQGSECEVGYDCYSYRADDDDSLLGEHILHLDDWDPPLLPSLMKYVERLPIGTPVQSFEDLQAMNEIRIERAQRTRTRRWIGAGISVLAVLVWTVIVHLKSIKGLESPDFIQFERSKPSIMSSELTMPALVHRGTNASSTAISTVVRYPTRLPTSPSASLPILMHFVHLSETTAHSSMTHGHVIELKLLPLVVHQHNPATTALSTSVIGAPLDASIRTLPAPVLDSIACAGNVELFLPPLVHHILASTALSNFVVSSALLLPSRQSVTTANLAMELMSLPTLIDRPLASISLSSSVIGRTFFTFQDKKVPAPSINHTLPELGTTSSVGCLRSCLVSSNSTWMLPHWNCPEKSKPSRVELMLHSVVHQRPVSTAASTIVSPRDLAVIATPFEFHQASTRPLSTTVSPRGLIISSPGLPRYFSVSWAPAITYAPVLLRHVAHLLVSNRPAELLLPYEPDLVLDALLWNPAKIQGEGAWACQGVEVLPVAYDVKLPLPPPEPPPPPFLHPCLAGTCMFELCCVILTPLLFSSLSGVHLSIIDSVGFPYLASRRR